jgi:putative FmdB family regulatory protein
MPIFEFICAECGKPFEELVVSNSKIGEVTCPDCHSQNITKKISRFAAKFFGGGSPSLGSSYSSPGCSTGSV